MGLLRRFERALEGVVDGTFARLFRSHVQPVELAAALQRELDRSAEIVSRDESLVPNDFVVALAASDHERLAQYEATLATELADVVVHHARTERYRFTGPVRVALARDDGLPTGRFRIDARALAEVATGADVGPLPPAGTAAPWWGGGAPEAAPEPAGGAVGAPVPAAVAPVPDDVGGERDRGAAPAVPATPAGPGDARTAAIPTGAGPVPLPYLTMGSERRELAPPGVVVGRAGDADVSVSDPGVSRRHAELRVTRSGTGYAVSVHDLGSTNGTIVDGQRVVQARLADGARLRLGSTTFVLHVPGTAPVPGSEGAGQGR